MQKHQESWRHIRKSEIVNRRKAKAKIKKKRERREKEILETRQDSEQEIDTEAIPLSKRAVGINKRKKSTDRNVGRKKTRVTSVDSPEVTNTVNYDDPKLSQCVVVLKDINKEKKNRIEKNTKQTQTEDGTMATYKNIGRLFTENANDFTGGLVDNKTFKAQISNISVVTDTGMTLSEPFRAPIYNDYQEHGEEYSNIFMRVDDRVIALDPNCLNSAKIDILTIGELYEKREPNKTLSKQNKDILKTDKEYEKELSKEIPKQPKKRTTRKRTRRNKSKESRDDMEDQQQEETAKEDYVDMGNFVTVNIQVKEEDNDANISEDVKEELVNIKEENTEDFTETSGHMSYETIPITEETQNDDAISCDSALYRADLTDATDSELHASQYDTLMNEHIRNEQMNPVQTDAISDVLTDASEMET